ncbi:MAG: hypothetical protein FWH01_06590 [Oscillospiraceae bacterium]|nr:hypothetical protein [Oscillospiraceae bacterium]
MVDYVILINPGHNRVYYKSAPALAVSELSLVASLGISARLLKVGKRTIEGVEYLAITVGSRLTLSDVAVLSNLSFVFALYEIVEINYTEYLKPRWVARETFVDESLSAILKYTGKTNELFTRMMINVAFCSLENAQASQPVKLLDPVAGKGTTLFEGLVRGFDVYGVEVGGDAAAEAYRYLRKFLETEKRKHKTDIHKISGPNKSFMSTRYSIDIAGANDVSADGYARRFEIITGNSVHAGTYFKKGFFDIIVGDLPYGVQHGNVTNQKQSSQTRNPSELLEACLPAWVGALRPGGAVVLAWNTHVLPRPGMEQLISGAGLRVLSGPAYEKFAHRVDQAIMRDIVVAVK